MGTGARVLWEWGRKNHREGAMGLDGEMGEPRRNRGGGGGEWVAGGGGDGFLGSAQGWGGLQWSGGEISNSDWFWDASSSLFTFFKAIQLSCSKGNGFLGSAQGDGWVVGCPGGGGGGVGGGGGGREDR
ncbi:unnamed protein product [Prunus armeniaca]